MNCDAALGSLGSRTPFASPYGEQRDGITLVWIPWLGGTCQGSCLRCLHQGSMRLWVEVLARGARWTFELAGLAGPSSAIKNMKTQGWSQSSSCATNSSPTLLPVLATHSLPLYVCLSLQRRRPLHCTGCQNSKWTGCI